MANSIVKEYPGTPGSSAPAGTSNTYGKTITPVDLVAGANTIIHGVGVNAYNVTIIDSLGNDIGHTGFTNVDVNTISVNIAAPVAGTSVTIEFLVP
jgi:hypothetical protein